MSKISTILTTLKTRIQAASVLPDHIQLTNPYNVAANTDQALKKGFGIAVLPGNNTNRQTSCNLSINRSIRIIVTRKFFATDLNVESKEATERDLLEDQFKIIKDIENEPSLNGLVMQSGYISDNGIQRVRENDDKFLKLESVFDFEYNEDLT